MAESPVGYAVSAGVAHLRLNRPQAANALDLPLARELAAAVSSAGSDDAVRAVLVSGEGARFCGGGDLRAIGAAPDPSAYVLELASEADAAVRALGELAKPVVCAVHGAVAGAGLGLMLSCDLVVAAPGTRFAFAYPEVGLTPDCGVSWLLPRAVGQQRALALALGGRPVDAATALEWGLVTEVADEPVGRAREVARAWADGQPVALGETRRLLRAGWEMTREDAGAVESRTIARLVDGDEASRARGRFTAG